MAKMDKRSLGVDEDTKVKPHVLDAGSSPVLITNGEKDISTVKILWE